MTDQGYGPVDAQDEVNAQQVYIDCAQRAAGVIAARSRRDFSGAETLLAEFPDDAAKTMGFFLLAELSLTLLAEITKDDLETVARNVSLDIVSTFTTG